MHPLCSENHVFRIWGHPESDDFKVLYKRGPEIPDEAGTVGEEAPAASLAWVLTTCAETVVECTDKEDFGDACVAVGPVHFSQLQTEPILL